MLPFLLFFSTPKGFVILKGVENKSCMLLIKPVSYSNNHLKAEVKDLSASSTPSGGVYQHYLVLIFSFSTLDGGVPYTYLLWTFTTEYGHARHTKKDESYICNFHL